MQTHAASQTDVEMMGPAISGGGGGPTGSPLGIATQTNLRQSVIPLRLTSHHPQFSGSHQVRQINRPDGAEVLTTPLIVRSQDSDMPPKACENCERLQVACSSVGTEKYPCTRCVQQGLQCGIYTPGPRAAKGTSCQECSKKKRKCSGTWPCERCKKSRINCTRKDGAVAPPELSTETQAQPTPRAKSKPKQLKPLAQAQNMSGPPQIIQQQNLTTGHPPAHQNPPGQITLYQYQGPSGIQLLPVTGSPHQGLQDHGTHLQQSTQQMAQPQLENFPPNLLQTPQGQSWNSPQQYMQYMHHAESGGFGPTSQQSSQGLDGRFQQIQAAQQAGTHTGLESHFPQPQRSVPGITEYPSDQSVRHFVQEAVGMPLHSTQLPVTPSMSPPPQRHPADNHAMLPRRSHSSMGFTSASTTPVMGAPVAGSSAMMRSASAPQPNSLLLPGPSHAPQQSATALPPQAFNQLPFTPPSTGMWNTPNPTAFPTPTYTTPHTPTSPASADLGASSSFGLGSSGPGLSEEDFNRVFREQQVELDFSWLDALGSDLVGFNPTETQEVAGLGSAGDVEGVQDDEGDGWEEAGQELERGLFGSDDDAEGVAEAEESGVNLRDLFGEDSDEEFDSSEAPSQARPRSPQPAPLPSRRLSPLGASRKRSSQVAQGESRQPEKRARLESPHSGEPRTATDSTVVPASPADSEAQADDDGWGEVDLDALFGESDPEAAPGRSDADGDISEEE